MIEMLLKTDSYILFLYTYVCVQDYVIDYRYAPTY